MRPATELTVSVPGYYSGCPPLTRGMVPPWSHSVFPSAKALIPGKLSEKLLRRAAIANPFGSCKPDGFTVEIFPIGNLRKQGIHRLKVNLLRKGVKGKLQAKAVGQRNLLFYCLGRMNFPILSLTFEVVGHKFRHKVATIGCSVYANVLWRQLQRAFCLL